MKNATFEAPVKQKHDENNQLKAIRWSRDVSAQT